MSSIFVQIASYKDPELIPTIQDLIANAEYPDKLTIAICNQTDDFTNLDLFRNDKRFRIIDIPWNESKGTCWARHELQKLWKDEEYTLQLDSHHRFEQNWDTTLIKMSQSTNSKKPILSTYVGSYSPITNDKDYVATVLLPDYFTEDSILMLKAAKMPGWKKRTTPLKGRFLSGHFIFAPGIFNREVKYDPSLYFHGEEISLSLRAYTHGYDIYQPHRPIIFHEYTRLGRKKHWDEHIKESNNNIEANWWERDFSSKSKLKFFFETLDARMLGEYGIGQVRTIQQYEKYAGINFKHQDLHPLTKRGKAPPINDKITWWKKNMRKYFYDIKIIKPNCIYDFIFIGVEDSTGKLLHRVNLANYQTDIRLNFISKTTPYKYVVWPYDKNGIFKERQDILL